ncbi:MAG TPA: hypothetical protein VGH33_28170, partial [Isosphaeraceae bacterium]
DVFAGNFTGLGINYSASSLANPGVIANSDFVFNTFGLVINASSASGVLATISNNIFWQNHSIDGKSGFAAGAVSQNNVLLFGNMFADNGPSLTSPADDTYNLNGAGGFNPAALNSVAPDPWGNFVGEPAFVAPRDPRPAPGGDGPGAFFVEANFDLTSKSAALDKSVTGTSPWVVIPTATDILYRGRVSSGKQWNTMVFGTTGPADVGAYEFNGTGGVGSGASSFHATSATLISGGVFNGLAQTVSQFNTSGVFAGSSATALIVKFSAPVNQSSFNANDLLISGGGDLNLKATGLTWIDSQTVEFTLAGGYNQSGGTVNISLGRNRATSASGKRLGAFMDQVNLSPGSPPQSPPTVPPIVPPTVPPSPVPPPPTVPPIVPPPPPTSPGSPPITPPPPPPTHS